MRGKYISADVALRLCCVLSLSLAGCESGAPAGGAEEAVAVSTGNAALVKVTPIRATRKLLVRYTEQPGVIEAFEETPLFAKVAGYVARVHVDIGDRVAGPRYDANGQVIEPGQVLVELDVPELEDERRQKQALVGQARSHVAQGAAAVRVAEAAYESAQARLEETQAATTRAQADYDRCKSEFERISALADRGAITRQIADEKENQFRAADATRKEVTARIASAQAALSEARVHIEKAQADHDAAKSTVAVAEAEERRVAALVAYTRIRAPYDGTVSARNVHTGHLVQAGTGSGGKPLLVVVRTDIVRIFIDVPEADAVFVQPGESASIHISSLSADAFPGTVTRMSSRLDSGTHTLKAEIDVENREGRLRPGMYAYADVKIAERPDALALPKKALWSADGQWQCYVVDSDGQVQKRPVTIGILAGDDVEIVSGLSGEEQIIGVNPAAFREGQIVDVAAPAK